MARKKKPERETEEQAKERRILETVSNASNRSEKTSWNRKMDNMVKLLARLRPIEERILQIIQEEKQPVLDEVEALRQMMVKECVHPYEHLVLKEDHVLCKFCDKRISIPGGFETI